MTDAEIREHLADQVAARTDPPAKGKYLLTVHLPGPGLSVEIGPADAPRFLEIWGLFKSQYLKLGVPLFANFGTRQFNLMAVQAIEYQRLPDRMERDARNVLIGVFEEDVPDPWEMEKVADGIRAGQGAGPTGPSFGSNPT